MKKIVEIEINGKLTDNSVVIFKDNKWIAVDKSVFLNDIYERIDQLGKCLGKEIANRTESEDEIKSAINKNAHKIKVLSGEDDYEEESI